MDSDKTVTANFSLLIEQYDLSTSSSPVEGGSVILDPSGGTYEEGTKVNVTADPAENYEFDHWSGAVSKTSKTTTVTIDKNKTITAHFVVIHDLSTLVEPTNGGSISVNPSKDNYEQGTEVTVTAEPRTDYKFDPWSGDITGTSKTKTVTMDSGKNITAHFSKIEYNISTSVESGSGSINLQPAEKSYKIGSKVTVKANPSKGYEFDHWSGDISGTSKTKTVTMDSDKNITAHFTEVAYTLSTTVSGSGFVSLNPPGGSYNEGTEVTVTAEPDEGYEFDHWSGDCPVEEKESKSMTLTMDSDKNITAHFTEEVGGSEGTQEGGGEGIPLIWIGVGAVIVVGAVAAFITRR